MCREDLSTPSLGITTSTSCTPAGSRAFNSLSRDHAVTPGPNLATPSSLSTPSLGITIVLESHWTVVKYRSLSTPSLGITREVNRQACRDSEEALSHFQLPLSGSLTGRDGMEQESSTIKRTFNSLSRDHKFEKFVSDCRASGFQLPLSGSLDEARTLPSPTHSLSTPSLGITLAHVSPLVLIIAGLSTPSLGITFTTTASMRGPNLQNHLLSTPSLGITTDCWNRQTSLSCSLSTPSLGITPGRVPFAELQRQRILSTPSLGITRPHHRAHRYAAPPTYTFNSLSRDHFTLIIASTRAAFLSTPSLRITNKLIHHMLGADNTAFNSLSRDHLQTS